MAKSDWKKVRRNEWEKKDQSLSIKLYHHKKENYWAVDVDNILGDTILYKDYKSRAEAMIFANKYMRDH